MPSQFQPSSVITTRVSTIGALLDGNSSFEPAGFQRAYAWRPENAERVLEGIVEAMDRDRKQKWYFLGSLTVSPRPRSPTLLIADGQQRLVTLTILFALLRDLAGGDTGADANASRVLIAPAGPAPEPRMLPQQDVRESFFTYVQSPLGTLRDVPEAELDEMSASEIHVIENRDALRNALAPLTPERRRRIAEFLASSCVVVVNEVRNEEDAREIFRVAHTTGIQLGADDVFKADVLSCVPRKERAETSRTWEEWQIKLGPDRMRRLFECIRNLRLRSDRHNHDVYEDLIESFGIERAAAAFVRNEFVPMASLYGSIMDGTIGGDGPAGLEMRRRLRYLEWLPHRDWMPPVFHLLRKASCTDGEMANVLRRIERLAYMHFIVSEQASKRHRRYRSVLGLIDARRVVETGNSLDLSKSERKQVEALLSGNPLKPRRARIHVLRRLNAVIDGATGSHLDAVASIEHIMPRNPAPDSEWQRDPTTQAACKETVDMLGNLCMLTPVENKEAENSEFSVKREILAGSIFALAKEAGARPTWSPDVIRDRTKWLVGRLMESWEG